MTLKENDVFEITMEIFELDDDRIDYEIYYFDLNNEIICDGSFTEEAEYKEFSDIRGYIAKYLKEELPEIEEYEVFDVNTSGLSIMINGQLEKIDNCQRAKIRIKSVKG